MQQPAPAAKPEAERTVQFVTDITLSGLEFDLLTVIYLLGGVRHFGNMQAGSMADQWVELERAGLVESYENEPGGNLTWEGREFLHCCGLPK